MIELQVFMEFMYVSCQRALTLYINPFLIHKGDTQHATVGIIITVA